MSFLKKLPVVLVLTVILSLCQSFFSSSISALSTNEASTSSDTIFELAINKAKPGQLEEFQSARAAFISKLKKEQGAGPNATFLSFFSTTDELDSEVYIGLGEWASIEAIQQATQDLGPGPLFKNYDDTFNQLAYVRMKPENGKPFDINDIFKKGEVVEFAAIAVKPQFVDAFEQRRTDFFDLVAQQEGYVLDREFLAVEGDLRVAIVAWDSLEDFQNALQNLSQTSEMQDFFSIVNVQTYQASQKIE